MPIFCQQNANSLKTHFSHVHIFSKNINSLKHTVVSYHFFQSCYEKPLAVVPIVGQKNRQFCQNYTILWAKKVNRMPFPPIFQEKTTSLMPIFCKKRPFSKKPTALVPIFCRKNVHPLKNTVLHVISIKCFMKKPLLSCQ